MAIDILTCGVVADGVTDVTERVQSVIDSLRGRGGKIVFPAGSYLCGSLDLCSDLTLEFESGATFFASPDRAHYPHVTEAEVPGFVRGTRRGIFHAVDQHNITICGSGLIDGNGSAWWGKEGDYNRPRTIAFFGCRDVTIRDIRIKDSPCWTIHPMCCENITIDNVSIRNPYVPNNTNTDGINPESCRNVRIINCYLDVGDDCITLKSGRQTDPYQRAHPCENITITNCTLAHGHGGVVIGSEMSGGVRNVTVSNCVFRDTERGIRIKARRGRGGTVEDVYVSNLIVDGAIAGFTCNMYYSCDLKDADTFVLSEAAEPVDGFTPAFRNISLENIRMKNIKACGIYLLGLPEMPVRGVSLRSVSIDSDGEGETFETVSNPRLPRIGGRGVYLKNVEDVTFTDVKVRAKEEALVTEGIVRDFSQN